ncbi:MAG TPA: glycosyltransferase family 39 protein [Myxococcota bacterium]|nr:glycosyltransferase family 39 protein [Myxococcota bacterium]
MVAAFAVQALHWRQTAAMMNDGPQFIRLAQRAAAGDWRPVLGHNFHPLYPAAVALAHQVVPDWERAAAGVSALAGALAVAALFALVREGFGRREAFVAALLLAVNATAIELADVQSDALYLALFITSAALLLRAWLRESGPSAFAAGLVAGLAYLARPEGAGTVLVGVGLAGWELARRRFSVSQALRIAAPLCLGAALTMGPYVAYRSVQAGGLELTGKKSLRGLVGLAPPSHAPIPGEPEDQPGAALDPLLAAHPELTPPPPGVRPFRDAPLPRGRAKLTGAAIDLLVQTLRALRPEGALFLVVGLWVVRGRPERRGRFFAGYALLYGAVLFALSASVNYLSRRHALPPASLLLGYAALGVGSIAAALARISALAGRPSLRRALPLALAAALGLGKSLRPVREDALPDRRAAEWIRRDGGLAQGEAVASVKQRVAYYAGAPYVDLRRAPHPALLLPYLRRDHVRFVVVDARERSELLALTRSEPDALELRHQESLGRHEAFVYELQP